MNPAWRQVFVHFDPWESAESRAVSHLAPVVVDAETHGALASWFFVRKAPCWRLRFLPADEATAAQVTTAIHQCLDALHHAGHIGRWVETIYEPETHAFGGPDAMDTAHTLFHRDSRNVVHHIAGDAGGKRREVAILLCSSLLRGARQDWHEQGDVWARVSEHRVLPPDVPGDRLRAMRASVRRLMTVDTASLTAHDGPLAFLDGWDTAFVRAGIELADMARNGVLRRGLRAVLAQHVIFAWNRIGLSHSTQSLLANVAAAVVLDE